MTLDRSRHHPAAEAEAEAAARICLEVVLVLLRRDCPRVLHPAPLLEMRVDWPEEVSEYWA